ncbi:hypothetical protein CYLTODRAFT_398711 [Cylindrobasidium torrendii FP15055 ss-10]|uniref:Uncharacterized protein n=1 Tax=Cylindrobasidium torrendii FP15055 ss-10 TaxID=1314674 RepID=A0A0D7B7I1_9AGAR|nr:hypothetical protein CYLTODRAFT_398711 [Cylindrobasidium torrendii FP15055 ss-10]
MQATATEESTPKSRTGTPATTTENPILIWLISLNRGYTADEYDAFYSFLNDYFSHIPLGSYRPEDPNSFRHIITQLLPILMMRHRRIGRKSWRDCVSPNGKHWIEQLSSGMQPDAFLRSMIGYHIQHGPSLCGIAMTQGVQKRVINLGLGIRLATLPKSASLEQHVHAFHSQLTPSEIKLIPLDEGSETALRRLAIILVLKDAYVTAIGQASSFDYRRLSFDVPAAHARCDGHPLTGWEFRIWNAKLGVARGDVIVEESYMCATAFFRPESDADSKFIWNDEKRTLPQWVQFLDIDQMLKVLPKLSA